MDHFSVIQSLCRVGLEAGDTRFRRQVERLRDRLKKGGDLKEATALDSLLVSVSMETSMAPSNVEVSRSLVSGDDLTANVHPPFDRETSVPLAQIELNPARGRPVPIYDETLRLALDALVLEWHGSEAFRRLGVEPSRSCLLYGPPGTGKTFIAQRLAKHVAADNVRLVQFHPAYAYEDFFEGFRPAVAASWVRSPSRSHHLVTLAARARPVP